MADVRQHSRDAWRSWTAADVEAELAPWPEPPAVPLHLLGQAVPPGYSVWAHTIHTCAPYFTDPNRRRWQHDRDVPPEWRRDFDVEQWRRQTVESNVNAPQPQTIGSWQLDHVRGQWYWKGWTTAPPCL